MIRIEGIPLVAAPLADAEKSKSTLIRNKRRRVSKIGTGGRARLAIRSAPHTKMKVA